MGEPTLAERSLKALDMYAAARDALARKAIYLALAATFIAAVSRMRVEVKVPFEIIDKPLHRGYVLLIGPAVIAALMVGFCRAVRDVLARREATLLTLQSAEAEKLMLTPAERFDLRPPLAASLSWARRPRIATAIVIAESIVVFGWPLFCYAVLLAGYFDLQASKEPSRAVDLLWGRFRGFSPHWPLAPELTMPWIYPPIQSWVYLLVAVFLAACAVRTIHAIVAEGSHTSHSATK